MAAHAELTDGSLSILAGVWSLDGKEKLTHEKKVRTYFVLVIQELSNLYYVACLK